MVLSSDRSKLAVMKRPKREKNAKLLLLDSVWADVLQDFKSKDEKRAQFGFTKAKAACWGGVVGLVVGLVSRR